MEKVNAEKTVCFIECGFVEARESFSEYCNLKETIPFDIMLHYENCYLENQQYIKEEYMNGGSIQNHSRDSP